MSHAEFFRELFKLGTGWLGWPPAVVLATPIPMLTVAIEGRMDLLRAIFGGSGKGSDGASLGTKMKAALSLRGTRRVVKEPT